MVERAFFFSVRPLIAALCLGSAATVQAQGAQMVFQNFDGGTVPKNLEGVDYPTYYYSDSEGGPLTISIDTSKKIAGSGSLKLTLTSGFEFYPQWNPWDGSNRDFARKYSADPKNWKFNTYNRMKLWIWIPTTAPAERTDGTQNYYLGTYVKRVTNPDMHSDETGGGHFYHPFNVMRGQWSLCVFNSHPGHERGQNGGTDTGNVLYPTSGDPPSTYNYFDALTRFYIQENQRTSSFPRTYWLDEIVFYQETRPENDDQVYSICASVSPENNRVFLTWNRPKSENSIAHEVRYAFSDIHTLGWNNATPAPGGTITPPGYQGYNGMVYSSTGINLSGKSVLYMAIKPQNSNVFSQIAIPLNGTAPSPTASPNPPTSLTAR